MSSTGDKEHYPGQAISRQESLAGHGPLVEKLVFNGLALLCFGTTVAWVAFLAWLFGWLVGLW
jgi:hypothetical protein